MKKYWELASDEIEPFKHGDVWHRRVLAVPDAQPERREVAGEGDRSRSEGATGWADTWMLAGKAKHPNCAYMWMQYDLDAEGAGAASRVLRRDAGERRLACSS